MKKVTALSFIKIHSFHKQTPKVITVISIWLQVYKTDNS